MGPDAATVKTAKAVPKKRQKKDADTKSNSLSAGEIKQKKPRAARGFGPRAIKKRLAEEAKKAAELAAGVQISAPQPPISQPPANHPQAPSSCFD